MSAKASGKAGGSSDRTILLAAIGTLSILTSLAALALLRPPARVARV